jgi:hypothetical protein
MVQQGQPSVCTHAQIGCSNAALVREHACTMRSAGDVCLQCEQCETINFQCGCLDASSTTGEPVELGWGQMKQTLQHSNAQITEPATAGSMLPSYLDAVISWKHAKQQSSRITSEGCETARRKQTPTTVYTACCACAALIRALLHSTYLLPQLYDI